MPSHGLIRQLRRPVRASRPSGAGTATTIGAPRCDWLANFDAQRRRDRRHPAATSTAPTRALWRRRWRLFFLATAGLFGDARRRRTGASATTACARDEPARGAPRLCGASRSGDGGGVFGVTSIDGQFLHAPGRHSGWGPSPSSIPGMAAITVLFPWPSPALPVCRQRCTSQQHCGWWHSNSDTEHVMHELFSQPPWAC